LPAPSPILAAAVDDERIAKNPCRVSSVKAPKVDRRQVVPWPRDRVLAVRRHLPERYRVLVDLAAGCGLRRGEAFGVAVDALDRDGGCFVSPAR
jgi:integrase